MYSNIVKIGVTIQLKLYIRGEKADVNEYLKTKRIHITDADEFSNERVWSILSISICVDSI